MSAVYHHRQRLEGVVKSALEQAALGESYGYAVSQGFVPALGPNGQPVGLGPGWLITVTIRDGLNPDPIGRMFPLPGLLPADKSFGEVARMLLEQCRAERDERNGKAMQQAHAGLAARERRS